MHLGNGALTPECAFLTLGAASAGLAVATVAARRERLDVPRLATAGALCAAVYAAQMVNVPVLPFSSAHLVGGVLLAWCLGPALGSLTMAVVLGVQALCLGDGGVMALGANVINMALLPAGLVWLGHRCTASNVFPHAVGNALRGVPLLSIALISFTSVLLSAGFIVGEVSLFRTSSELANLGEFTSQMLGLHAWIGLGEALATCAVVFALGALAKSKVGWAHSSAPSVLGKARPAFALLVASHLLVALLPFASTLPDGYEAAVEVSGLKTLLLDSGSVVGWQTSLQSGLEAALPGESAIALVTMCLAGLLACGVAFASQMRLLPARVSKHRVK